MTKFTSEQYMADLKKILVFGAWSLALLSVIVLAALSIQVIFS